jgi:pilus assembly protein Flp/PilA
VKAGRFGDVQIQVEGQPMKNMILNSLVRLRSEEDGQGLVEYVLILALIAFAAVAGMSSLASSINSAFTKVGTYLGKYIS